MIWRHPVCGLTPAGRGVFQRKAFMVRDKGSTGAASCWRCSLRMYPRQYVWRRGFATGPLYRLCKAVVAVFRTSSFELLKTEQPVPDRSTGGSAPNELIPAPAGFFYWSPAPGVRSSSCPDLTFFWTIQRDGCRASFYPLQPLPPRVPPSPP